MAMTKGISLRRSCNACTKVKRRCNPQLPQCTRCLQKGIECVYDIEPPTRREIHREPFQSNRTIAISAIQESESTVLGQLSVSDMISWPTFPQAIGSTRLSPYFYSQYLLQTGASIYQPSITETRMTCGDEATILYLDSQLKALPTTFARAGCTPFIHPKLYQKRLPVQIQDIFTVCGSYSVMTESNAEMFHRILCLKFDNLINCYRDQCSFEDILASVHALMLYLIILLLGGDTQLQNFAEPHLERLNQWTLQLWEHAPSQMPDSLSHWEAWLFAESVRRTILFSYVVRGLYSELKRGYCTHQLFIDALPFDARPGLWEAQSESAWESLKPGPCSSMVSFHEYSNGFALGQVKPTTLFETLILVEQHGTTWVEPSLRPGHTKDSAASAICD